MQTLTVSRFGTSSFNLPRERFGRNTNPIGIGTKNFAINVCESEKAAIEATAQAAGISQNNLIKALFLIGLKQLHPGMAKSVALSRQKHGAKEVDIAEILNDPGVRAVLSKAASSLAASAIILCLYFSSSMECRAAKATRARSKDEVSSVEAA